jgi:prophage antirepressor-like protein
MLRAMQVNEELQKAAFAVCPRPARHREGQDMNDIIPFAYEGKAVRTVKIGGVPWFVATDVCAALNIGAHRLALDKLDDDEKGRGVEVHTLGGIQKVASRSLDSTP